MNILGVVFALSAAWSSSPVISGSVVNSGGAPVQGARVFLEPGLSGNLLETRSGEGGVFTFPNAPEGLVGLFAIAEGHAFGGMSLTVAVADSIANVRVQLGDPGSVSGKIVDPRNKPIGGARITRVLLTPGKVSIPLAKLQAFGFSEPVSSSDGSFTVSHLPVGATVALKVGHPDYAQAGATGISVGETKTKIAMNPGVLVRGRALARGGQTPVANAQVILKRAVEPHDAVVIRTDASGNFVSRLEPGPYFAQAETPDYKSASWEKLNVTGETPEVRLTLHVGGVGAITGVVADAVTAKPVAGAKLSLSARGTETSRTSTGPTGEFSFSAAEGDNIVTLDGAPGYLAPEQSAFKVSVVPGQSVNLPTFWLVAIPSYSVQVIDADLKPVPGAVVSILRPAQFGWRLTDANGRTPLQFGSLPSDGVIVGIVEHPTLPLGAVFALDRTKADNSQVLLMPLASVHGEVVAKRGKELVGAVVGAVLADAPFADDVLLWQTLARDGGVFEWGGVVPKAPLKIIAKAGADSVGESPDTTFEMGERKDVGRIVVEEGVSGKSLYGKELKWRDNPVIGGAPSDAPRPGVVVYCNATEASAVIEGLSTAKTLFGDRLEWAVVVNGAYTGPTGSVCVLRGAPPGSASTYLVDQDSRVVLETFGMPPLRALQVLVPTTP